jgi:exosome complex component RRP4
MQRIVVPGEKLEDKPLRIDEAFIDDGKTYSTIMSMYDDEKKILMPLEGLWYPRSEDTVVGVVQEDKFNVLIIDLDSPYRGLIFAKDTNEDLVAGDIIEATVKELDKTKTVILGRPRKLAGGKILYVKPSKIGRILGKGNSMIKQLSGDTQTYIVVGMNGLIWMKGGKIDLCTEAIVMIQQEAHTSGLTNRVKNLLEMGK